MGEVQPGTSSPGSVESHQYIKTKVTISSPVEKKILQTAASVVKGQTTDVPPSLGGGHRLTTEPKSITAFEQDQDELEGISQEGISWELVESGEGEKVRFIDIDPRFKELEEAEKLDKLTGEEPKVQVPETGEEEGPSEEVSLTEEPKELTNVSVVPVESKESESKKTIHGAPDSDRSVESRESTSKKYIRGTPASESGLEIRKNILLNRIERKAKEIATRIKSTCVFRWVFPRSENYGVAYCRTPEFQNRWMNVPKGVICLQNSDNCVELVGKVGNTRVVLKAEKDRITVEKNGVKITYETGDVLQSGCAVIVNPCNPEGRIGGGLCEQIGKKVLGTNFKKGALQFFGEFQAVLKKLRNLDSGWLDGQVLARGGAIMTPTGEWRKESGGYVPQAIIHTAPPRGGIEDRKGKMAQAYLTPLELASGKLGTSKTEETSALISDEVKRAIPSTGFSSIAFPSLGTGLYNCPIQESAEQGLRAMLMHAEKPGHLKGVYVLFRNPQATGDETIASYTKAICNAFVDMVQEEYTQAQTQQQPKTPPPTEGVTLPPLPKRKKKS